MWGQSGAGGGSSMLKTSQSVCCLPDLPARLSPEWICSTVVWSGGKQYAEDLTVCLLPAWSPSLSISRMDLLRPLYDLGRSSMLTTSQSVCCLPDLPACLSPEWICSDHCMIWGEAACWRPHSLSVACLISQPVYLQNGSAQTIVWSGAKQHAEDLTVCLLPAWSRSLSISRVDLLRPLYDLGRSSMLTTSQSVCCLLDLPASVSGVTRGVTVSKSAFLTCHPCYCAGSSLAWGLNLRAVACGIFWSSSPGVFSGYTGFLPSFIGLMAQPIKQSSNKCDFNSVKLNSWAVPSYQVARSMTLARDKRSTCCTWFAHNCARATWAYVLETVRGAVRRL